MKVDEKFNISEFKKKFNKENLIFKQQTSKIPISFMSRTLILKPKVRIYS